MEERQRWVERENKRITDSIKGSETRSVPVSLCDGCCHEGLAQIRINAIKKRYEEKLREARERGEPIEEPSESSSSGEEDEAIEQQTGVSEEPRHSTDEVCQAPFKAEKSNFCTGCSSIA